MPVSTGRRLVMEAGCNGAQDDLLVRCRIGDLLFGLLRRQRSGFGAEYDQACLIVPVVSSPTDLEVVQVVGPLTAHSAPGGSTLIVSDEDQGSTRRGDKTSTCGRNRPRDHGSPLPDPTKS